MTTFHQNARNFREALTLTQQSTGFQTRLIEKDYFCTILLEYLAAASSALVFKGGTCLAKVHARFYRLSEDLDFAIPMPVDATRSERSQRVTGLKAAVEALPNQLPAFRLVEPLTGANSSTQYVAVVSYASLVSMRQENIKLEIGLREPLLTPVFLGSAQTILLDPVSHTPLVNSLELRCISKLEALAEKFRAAMSRREVAIRDFFDIDFAVRRLDLRPQDAALIRLVRQKLEVPGNTPADVSDQRLATLRQQVEPQLKPVLRPSDFQEFDLDRSFHIVVNMAAQIRRLALRQ